MLTMDPTGGIVWNANRGVISLRITVRGRPAHVGLHLRGVNAFRGMLDVAGGFAALEGEVARRVTAFTIRPDADGKAAPESRVMATPSPRSAGTGVLWPSDHRAGQIATSPPTGATGCRRAIPETTRPASCTGSVSGAPGVRSNTTRATKAYFNTPASTGSLSSRATTASSRRSTALDWSNTRR